VDADDALYETPLAVTCPAIVDAVSQSKNADASEYTIPNLIHDSLQTALLTSSFWNPLFTWPIPASAHSVAVMQSWIVPHWVCCAVLRDCAVVSICSAPERACNSLWLTRGPRSARTEPGDLPIIG
jgi:hypothetical protein